MNLNQLLRDVSTTLIANFIFAILVAGLAIGGSRYIARRRVRAFFGIKPSKGQLPLYLSNIYVRPRGTVGTEPIRKGFHGTAISEVEYHHALQFANAVETKPSVRALRALDPGDRFPVEPILCKIGISPFADDLGDPSKVDILSLIRAEVGNRSVIVIGAPVYNTLSLHLMEKLQSRFNFLPPTDDNEERGITFLDDRGRLRTFTRTPVDGSGRLLEEYYILEKLEWSVTSDDGDGATTSHTKVFICAGTSSAATAAALLLLERNWRKLERHTKGRNFGIICSMLLEDEELREKHPKVEHVIEEDHYGFDGLLS